MVYWSIVANGRRTPNRTTARIACNKKKIKRNEFQLVNEKIMHTLYNDRIVCSKNYCDKVYFRSISTNKRSTILLLDKMIMSWLRSAGGCLHMNNGKMTTTTTTAIRTMNSEQRGDNRKQNVAAFHTDRF